MSYPEPEGGEAGAGANRVEQLYHAAAELPVCNQDEFLVRSCAGDEKLRETVMSLLNASREVPQAWDRGALEMEARHTAVDITPAHPDEFFGPYRIVRCIAAGGMGLVYEALRGGPARASQSGRSSGPQTGQYSGDSGGRAQTPGFRNCEVAHQAIEHCHRPRDDTRVCQSGAVARAKHHDGQRHLLAGRAVVRDAGRSPALRRHGRPARGANARDL